MSNDETRDATITGPVCKRGHLNEPGANRCATCGITVPLTRLAEQHGATTLERRGVGALPPTFQAVRQERVDRMLVDLGGAENLSELERGLVERAGQLSAMLDLFEADFEARGMWTARGRQRSSVAAYLSTLDRYDRLAMRVGLARRAKQVPQQTPADYMRRKLRERELNIKPTEPQDQPPQ